jgi:E3 ubiquitin-protein ligase DOA10
MPKNIEFPTDSKLYDKARERLVKLASKNGIALRQNYNLVAKTLLRKISGYLHAKQMKRARKAIKHLRTIVGRVVRDVERKISNSAQKNFSPENSRNAKNLSEIFTPILDQDKRLLAQEREGIKTNSTPFASQMLPSSARARLTNFMSSVVKSRSQQLTKKGS